MGVCGPEGRGGVVAGECGENVAAVADGAAAKHDAHARHEAARKLIGNHAAVLGDLTRDGPPPTQSHLQRVTGRKKDVDKLFKTLLGMLRLGQPMLAPSRAMALLHINRVDRAVHPS